MSTDYLYPHVRAACDACDPYDLFLGFWERLGWRHRHEHARFFSSPPRVTPSGAVLPNGGYRWPYPTFS